MALASTVGVGAVAAPFTAGSSLGASFLVASATTVTVGSGTNLAATAVGGVVFVYSIYNDYSFKIRYGKNGLEIIFTSKKHKHEASV